MPLRVPYRWLQEFVLELPPAAELVEQLTIAGLEVERLVEYGADWSPEHIRVATLEAVEAHPQADRLCIAQLRCGSEPLRQVVTAAPNIFAWRGRTLPKAGFCVPVALPGASLIDGHDPTKRMRIRAGNLRGVRSEGVLCSELELGLGQAHEGIMELPAEAPSGAALRDWLGDQILEFDIKGGFAHLLSLWGVAREAAAICDLRLRSTPWRDQTPHAHTQTPPFARLKIVTPQLCSRYSAVLVSGLRVGEAPFWVRQRLLQVGMRPINAVVDATNYVLLESGQPLHAFDYDRLRPGPEGMEIHVRNAHKGELLRTLDGVERCLEADTLVIADGAGAVALAGVMGGAESEISADTHSVLIEAANFEFLSVRRTCQRLRIHSEAADRFGRRLSPSGCLEAALRCAERIVEWCGGKIHAPAGDLYPQAQARHSIELSAERLQAVLGVPIAIDEATRILTQLEFQVEQRDPLREVLFVTPPAYRLDVNVAADVVEELGRIYGYDRMLPSFIAEALPPPVGNQRLAACERIRDLLCACGLDEVISYSIVSPMGEAALGAGSSPAEPSLAESPLQSGAISDEFAQSGTIPDEFAQHGTISDEFAQHGTISDEFAQHGTIPDEFAQSGTISDEFAQHGTTPDGEASGTGASVDAAADYVQLRNPLVAGRSVLRRRLLPGVLQVASRNLRFMPRVCIFELGTVFLPRKDAAAAAEALPHEPLRLCAVLVGAQAEHSWMQEQESPGMNFYDIKGVAEALLQGLGIFGCTWEADAGEGWIRGRSVRLRHEGTLLGRLGEVHPSCAEPFGFSSLQAVRTSSHAAPCAMELDVEALLQLRQEFLPIRPLPQHPPVREDLAFIVSQETPAETLRTEILRAGTPLVDSVRAFDVYQGAPLAEGEKSIAFALQYQHPQRTLKSTEVARQRTRIVKALDQLGAKLRT